MPDDSEGNWKEKGCEAFNATNPDQEYIMGNDGERKLWEYFFSPCSQKSMRKFLQLEQANCFRNLSTLTTPLIDTSSQCNEASVYGGISLEEQCRVFINSSEAYIVPVRNISRFTRSGSTRSKIRTKFLSFRRTATAWKQSATWILQTECFLHSESLTLLTVHLVKTEG